MSNLKKIIYKIWSLIILLVLLNFVYLALFYEKDLQEHSELINKIRAIDPKAEIVYFGESSNTSFDSLDCDQRSISKMCADYFPSITFGHVTKVASHGSIYKTLIQQLNGKPNIKTVIVTLNLRTFNADCRFSNLETPLQKSLVLLKNYPPLFNRFLLSFKVYDIKTKKQREAQVLESWKMDSFIVGSNIPYRTTYDWNDAMSLIGVKNPDGTLNQKLTDLACHYIKGYAFVIDTLTNPRIKDFDEIVAYAKAKHWNLVFNLLAENIQTAKTLVNDELVSMIKQNRNMLVQRYESKGVLVVDQLQMVDSAYFTDKTWTTEHYNETGRKIIARNLAYDLQLFHPNQFIDHQKNILKGRVLKSNCDGEVQWSQVQTLSEEMFFSPVRSSKIDSIHPYSLTLEQKVEEVSDSSIRSIIFNAKLFRINLNSTPKLILEINSNGKQSYWTGVDINSMSPEASKWLDIEQTFLVGGHISTGDVIKIYLFNESSSPVYIDNFKVSFL